MPRLVFIGCASAVILANLEGAHGAGKYGLDSMLIRVRIRRSINTLVLRLSHTGVLIDFLVVRLP